MKFKTKLSLERNLEEVNSKLKEIFGTDIILGYEELDKNYRQSGRTTRLVDEVVQKLFKERSVEVSDHHPTLNATRVLCDKVIYRMWHEHNIKVEISTFRKQLYDFTITLKIIPNEKVKSDSVIGTNSCC